MQNNQTNSSDSSAATNDVLPLPADSGGDSGTGLTRTVNFYNDAGQLVESDNYDTDGRLSSKKSFSFDAAGNPTRFDATVFNTDGSTVEDVLNFPSGGSGVPNKQHITTSSSGDVVDTISGAGAVVQLSNATIILNAGAQATIAGSNDNITAGAGVTLDLQGAGHTFSGGANDTVNVSGNGAAGVRDLITVSNGTVNLAADVRADVVGSNTNLNVGAGDMVGVYGGGNVISAARTASLWIANTDGNFDAVTADGANVNLNTGTQVSLSGTGNSISEATGSSLYAMGGGNTISAAAGSLTAVGNTNGVFDQIIANGDGPGGITANGQGTGIYLLDNSQAVVSGFYNGISEAAGSSLYAFGGGNVINAAAGSLTAIGSTSGIFDQINANGDGLGGTTANGQGTGIYMLGDTSAIVSGSYNGINEASGASLYASGGGNTIYTVAGALAVIGNTGGVSDAVNTFNNGSGGTDVYVLDNSQASINGKNVSADTYTWAGQWQTSVWGADLTLGGQVTVGISNARPSLTALQTQALTQLNQLIGAMASFAPPSSASTSTMLTQDSQQRPQIYQAPLLAAAH